MELAEVLTDTAADITADIAGRTELLIKLTSRTELEVQVKIQQPKELEALLIAICYWDSLKSQTSL